MLYKEIRKLYVGLPLCEIWHMATNINHRNFNNLVIKTHTLLHSLKAVIHLRQSSWFSVPTMISPLKCLWEILIANFCEPSTHSINIHDPNGITPWLKERQRDREGERQKERKTVRKRERQRERDRQTDRERERGRDRDRDRERTDRQTDRQTDREREREKENREKIEWA